MPTTILEYSKTEAALAILRDKFSIVPDVSTKSGYKQCKEDAKEVGKYRIDLEKMRTEIKGPALKKCKEIDSEAKRITAELLSIETPLKEAYKAVDAEKKRIDELRIQSIVDRIEGINTFIEMGRDGNSEEIAEWIEQVSDIDCAEGFDEMTKEALITKNKTLESLQNYMEQAITKDIEAKELADKMAAFEAEKKEAAAAKKIADDNQRENDHEFGLMMNDKFNTDRERDKEAAEQEEKEQAERLKVERELREKHIAEQAAANAEIEKQAAEERAAQAEKRASEAAAKATEEEKQRQYNERIAEDAKIAKVEANKAHTGKILKSIKEQIMKDCGIDEATAKKVIHSINKIERIKINFM